MGIFTPFAIRLVPFTLSVGFCLGVHGCSSSSRPAAPAAEEVVAEPEFWSGTIDRKLPFAVRLIPLDERGAQWIGLIDMVDRLIDFPLTDVRVTADSIRFTLAADTGAEPHRSVWTFVREPRATEIEGTMELAGEVSRVIMTRTQPDPPALTEAARLAADVRQGLQRSSTAEPPRPVPHGPAAESPRPGPGRSTVFPASTIPIKELGWGSWVWYHAYPEKPTGGLERRGTRPWAVLDRPDAPFRIDARREGGEIVVACENLDRRSEPGVPPAIAWNRRISVPGEGAPIVTVTEVHVVVAVRTTGGYRVLVLDSEGGRGPTDDLTIEDPPGGSFGTATPIQLLDASGGRIFVWVRGEGQAYLDVVEIGFDPPVPPSRSVFDASFLHEYFAPPRGQVRGQAMDTEWPGIDGSYRVTRRDTMTTVTRRDRDGNERWRTDIDPLWRTDIVAATRPADHAAAVLEIGDLVVVLQYVHTASGAQIAGVDRATGALRGWPIEVGGIDPFTAQERHKQYHIEVGLIPDGTTRLIVYGDESDGQYVSVVDLAEWIRVGFEVWRR